jgi:hypothetical protein
MKKFSSFLAGSLFLLIAFTSNAQTKTGADFFAGKWTVLVKGTPQGDAKMIYILEKKDDKLTGVIQDTTGAEVSKIDRTEVKDSEITIYFNTQGFDVNVTLAKKDDDHVTGSLLGMFDAEGERIKDAK